MKNAAIIVDLDGTLYNATARQEKHLRGTKKDFEAFHRDAEHDSPYFWCAQLIQAMRNAGCRIIFSSGRDNTYQMQTEKWLKRHLNWEVGEYDLFMRPAGDYTADDRMKESWLPLLKDRYDILFAIDEEGRRFLMACCSCAFTSSVCADCGQKRVFADAVIFNSEKKGEHMRFIHKNGQWDSVNRPAHYNTGKIEVIEFIEDQRLGYHLGNAVKYVCRAGRKDPAKKIEDLEKAAWYLSRKIEKLKSRRDKREAVRPNEMNP